MHGGVTLEKILLLEAVEKRMYVDPRKARVVCRCFQSYGYEFDSAA